MGQEEEEDVTLDPSVVKEDQDALQVLLSQLAMQYDDLSRRIAKIPDLIGPPKDVGEPKANGKLDGAEAAREGARQDGNPERA